MPNHKTAAVMLFALGLVLGGCATTQPATYAGYSASPARQARTFTAAAPVRATAKQAGLRVMTFNLRRPVVFDAHNHWSNRKPRVARFIQRTNPDIIGTQECLASQAAYLKEQLPAYAKIGAGRIDGYHGGEMCAIFYKRDRLSPLKHGHFWLSRRPNEPGSTSWGAFWPRMVSWARFQDRQTGEVFYVFNTHFSVLSEEAREKSADFLARSIQHIAGDAPVIITGDFNTNADTPPHQRLTDDGFADTYRFVNRNTREPGTRHHFRGGIAGGRIDWVLACADFKVIRADVLDQPFQGGFVSDHHPVYADLLLKADTRFAHDTR